MTRLHRQLRGRGEYADFLESDNSLQSSSQLEIHIQISPSRREFEAEAKIERRTTLLYPSWEGLLSQIDTAMARTYSDEELLEMRDTLPVVICDLNKLNPDAAPDIIKVPDSSRSSLKPHGGLPKNIGRHSKANTSGSSHTHRSRFGSLESHLEVAHISRGSDDVEQRIFYNGRLVDLQEEDTKVSALHHRGISDQSNQIFPTPSGLEAQKADNFKRFYEAVVSPSHLRVTAGGRIVPNTRGPPQPEFIWDPKNNFFERIKYKPSTELEKKGSMEHGGNLSAANPEVSIGLTRPALPNTEPRPPPKESNENSRSATEYQSVEKTGRSHLDSSSSTETEIKISPPSLFDPSKPCIYKGQLLWPAQPGFQAAPNESAIPLAMLGIHNISHPPHGVPQRMMPATALQFPAGNVFFQQSVMLDGLQMGQQGPFMAYAGFNPLMTPAQLPQNISMLSPAPFLEMPVPTATMPVSFEAQTQALEERLKQLDNQLQNNRHQIDVHHITNLQHRVQDELHALQAALNFNNFPAGAVPYEQYRTPAWDAGLGVGTVPLAPITNLGVFPVAADSESHGVKIRRKTSSHAGFALQKAESVVTGPGQFTPGKYSSPGSETVTSKRLSAAAAMAPPFQPRSKQAILSQFSGSKSKAPTSDSSSPSKKLDDKNDGNAQFEVQGFLNSGSCSTRLQTGPLAVIHDQIMETKAKIVQGDMHGGHFINSPTKFQTFSSSQLAVSSDPKVVAGNRLKVAVPYLLGYPPSGMSFDGAESSDLIYSRELTEEERCARHLYWGKAPHEISKGLPKFDGRNFYPPSPTKVPAVPAAIYSDTSCQLNPGANRPIQPESLEYAQTKLNSNSGPGSGYVNATVETVNSGDQSLITTPVDYASGDDDTASIDSWGVPRAQEDTIISRSSSQGFDFQEMVSSERGHGFSAKSVPFARLASVGQAQPSFLKDMLRNSSRTATAAATDALSSATAHGYLPQYSGSAAASLTHPVANTGKTHKDVWQTRRAASTGSVRIGNHPLGSSSAHQDAISASDLQRKVSSQEKHDTDLGSHPKTTGIGPVFDGSDW